MRHREMERRGSEAVREFAGLRKVLLEHALKPILHVLVILIAVSDINLGWAQTAKRRARPVSSQGSSDQVAKKAAEAREANRVDEAIALYRQALKSRPSWGEGWWYLGTMLYDLERHAESRDALMRLAAIKPDGGPTWALIGLCEFRLREYQQALVHLMRARILGFGPSEEIAFVSNYHAVLLLTRFEQFEGGFEILYQLAKGHPGNPTITEAYGINLLRLPYLPAELPPEKREMVLRVGRAAGLFVANRNDEAKKEFEDLFKDYPKTPNLHYALGLFTLRDSPDAAMGEFKRELDLAPKHVPALLQIAFEHLKRNEYQAGLPFAETAVQADRNSFPARNALGRILLELGQTERAIKELEFGVQLAPESPEMRFALARAYSKAGRKNEATKERTEFMRLDKLRRQQREVAPAQIPATEP